MIEKKLSYTLTLAAGGLVSVGAHAQIQATQAGVVVPVPLEQEAEPWFRPAPEGAERLVSPHHPPIDQIPAMEMPNTDLIKQFENLADAGVPVIYEPGKGERFADFFAPEDGKSPKRTPGFIPAIGQHDYEPFGIEGLGTKSLINDDSAFPWRMNCKLVIEYEDSNPNVGPIYRVCSASMIDAETVLSAGHCVFKHDLDSTGVEYGWADRIWVYPGWDGNGLTLGTPDNIQTHGYMVSTSLSAFTGWTVSESFDWDLGLIRTGRAAGMLTGWYGRDWDETCSTIQGRTYHNASFPAENCPTAGLHNGQEMYYWFGDIDDCPGNQMEIDTTAGCLTALWGGESGSGIYHIDNGDRFVHGAASNSNRSTIGRYAKIWENFYNHTTDFINTSRGGTLDFQSLRSRYVETSVTAGNPITGARYYIANPTNFNPASNSYDVSHYLSTNDIISTFDTRLRGESFTFDFAAVQGTDINNDGITYTIPINTPSGTYWVGALLEETDANSANNAPTDWDAHQITVNGIADLVAQSVSGPTQAFLGESITVDYSVLNQGGDPSNTVVTEIRLSTNNIISTLDRLLGTHNTSGLAGEQTLNTSRTVTIPADTAPGTYYLGIISDSSDDVNASNNDIAATVTIQIDGRADLVATNITANSGTATQGGTLPISYTVSNDGQVSSGGFNVDFYASTNTTITTFDTLIGSVPVGSIGQSGSFAQNRNLNIPASLTPGDYYIGMIVSPGADENNLSDNTNFDPQQVTVIDPCLADVNMNGQVEPTDFGAWLNAYNAGDPAADQNGDGMVTPTDFGAWLSNYNAGC